MSELKRKILSCIVFSASLSRDLSKSEICNSEKSWEVDLPSSSDTLDMHVAQVTTGSFMFSDFARNFEESSESYFDSSNESVYFNPMTQSIPEQRFYQLKLDLQ